MVIFVWKNFCDLTRGCNFSDLSSYLCRGVISALGKCSREMEKSEKGEHYPHVFTNVALAMVQNIGKCPQVSKFIQKYLVDIKRN